MTPLAEHGEEVLEFEMPDAGQLQFQQRGLARIGVHRMDAGRRDQRIVQHIAAGAGDHQHAILRPQRQRQPVDRGILPAGVVYERAGIDGVEHLLIQPVDQ